MASRSRRSMKAQPPTRQGPVTDLTKAERQKNIILEFQVTPPDNPLDLDALADATELAFKLLVPWCQEKHSSLALLPIARQAALYVQAIDFSIVASQQGFNIAEEAINFSQDLKEDSEEPDERTEIERQKYLRRMVDIAVRGHQMAEDSMMKFRKVRETMNELIDKAKAKEVKQGSKDQQVLTDLTNNIAVLERFAGHISQYAGWWNNMEMLQNSQEERTKAQVMSYSSLREESVILKWEELRDGYTCYTNKIRVLQDAHPTLFVESRLSLEKPKTGILRKLWTKFTGL
ncbi:hypothetical protein B0H34DRAFT_65685 [Crassisporium funariophilum]|nr:hypothetical protein B0H34DRAFT_65685 [Crassisporium funariophilum]